MSADAELRSMFSGISPIAPPSSQSTTPPADHVELASDPISAAVARDAKLQNPNKSRSEDRASQPGARTGQPGGRTSQPGARTGQPGGRTGQPGERAGSPAIAKSSAVVSRKQSSIRDAIRHADRPVLKVLAGVVNAPTNVSLESLRSSLESYANTALFKPKLEQKARDLGILAGNGYMETQSNYRQKQALSDYLSDSASDSASYEHYFGPDYTQQSVYEPMYPRRSDTRYLAETERQFRDIQVERDKAARYRRQENERRRRDAQFLKEVRDIRRREAEGDELMRTEFRRRELKQLYPPMPLSEKAVGVIHSTKRMRKLMIAWSDLHATILR